MNFQAAHQHAVEAAQIIQPTVDYVNSYKEETQQDWPLVDKILYLNRYKPLY